MKNPPLIHVIDDDASLRAATIELLNAAGYRARGYASTGEFLLELPGDEPGCLLLDVRLPGPSGLDLQAAMGRHGITLPVIFLTGYADVPTSVRAMKAGAVDFLTKPVRDKDLLDAIARAEQQDAGTRQTGAEVAAIEAKIATLTPREREVLTHVIAGRLNKQIAGDLGTVEKTIKVHRGRMMEKLGVRTIVDLVRLAEKAGIAAHGK